MSSSPTVAFLCASLREGSINQQLEGALMAMAGDLGLAPDKVDLNDYEMPLFHGDLKPPASVDALIERLGGYDAVVVVTPEYNGSLPPLLKNVIDWSSTFDLAHIRGPVWGIASCTPGPPRSRRWGRRISTARSSFTGRVRSTRSSASPAVHARAAV